MTSNELAIPAAVGQPDRVGQATAVEQSRAIAEVQGAILVAQRCPRNVNQAVADMEASCEQKGLADRAFYAVPRAGGTVNGATVHLARELARVWGNVQYGVSEMRRDDLAGQSEMLAFAWDVQTNTRVETKFVVPHMRDTKSGSKKLTSMDDIYMSNANSGARRVRECIFSILPPWFVEQAKENCQRTLEHGGGVALPKRISAIIKAFDELGVSTEQLESRMGKPNAKWTARDVAQLTTIGGSLRRGEIQRDEEFPPVRVKVDDLGEAPTSTTAPAPASTPARPSATAGPPATNGAALSPTTMKHLHALLSDCGVVEAERHATLGLIAGRTIGSANDLAKVEAAKVIDVLDRCAKNAEPATALEHYLANVREGEGQ